MARKFSFDASIGTDMKAASADSFLDNMKMIDFEEIKLNKENFYELSELELLADDIERQGLKHNLVVSKDSGGTGYWLISGHRRYCAIKMLIEQHRLTSTLIPCYIDGERTQAEARLNLIMLNATQRKYTDAETMAEYETLKATFQQLEDEGKPVKGRIRELIAKTLNVSPAQVGKIENIKNNAIEEVHEAVKNGEMSISTANEVAKLTPEKQEEIIAEKPNISHKEVKEIQKAEKAEIHDDFDEDDDDFDEDCDEDDYDFDEEQNESEEKCATYSTKSTPSKSYTLVLTEEEISNLSEMLELAECTDLFGDEQMESAKSISKKIRWIL